VSQETHSNNDQFRRLQNHKIETMLVRLLAFMWTPQMPSDGLGRMVYGFGWQGGTLEGVGDVGDGGTQQGTRAMMLIAPDAGAGVVVWMRGAPQVVFRNDAEDQLPQLLRGRNSPNRSPDSGDQPPIHAKAGPVPADYSYRSDDDDRLLPSRPQPTDGNPEELVKQIESRPRTPPLQHGLLLSQHEVFKDKIPAVAEDSKERPEREPQHAEHNRSYNRILAAAAGYVIGFKVGQSCGEPQDLQIGLRFNRTLTESPRCADVKGYNGASSFPSNLCRSVDGFTHRVTSLHCS